MATSEPAFMRHFWIAKESSRVSSGIAFGKDELHFVTSFLPNASAVVAIDIAQKSEIRNAARRFRMTVIPVC